MALSRASGNVTRNERWARWSEIERVLDQALEQPAGLRPSFLDAACAADPELREAVERLLAVTEAALPILDSPASDQVAPIAAMLRQHARLLPGSHLGGYEVIRELGRGGMATVYLAHDHKHDRDVALKVLHAELAAVVGAERFLQEIRVTARLGHPHIITLIESGESDGFLWYVIPSITGASLRERLDGKKRLGIEEVLTIARQIGGALDYAHRNGVIHRDIKPENILLHEGEAMLADFGIALAVHEAGGSRLMASGVPIGTPQYMSPEQAKGNAVDARSDVFSFGAVVYEMFAGTAPHAAATSREVIERILRDPPPMLRATRKEIPPHVEAAVAKALAKEPDERFASPGDFVQALDASPRLPVYKRRPVLIAAALVAGVVLGAAALLPVRPPPRSTPVVRDRTQLTMTGEAIAPAISPDGAEVAYVVRQCAAARCSYAIETVAVGSGSSRRVMDGWSAVYRISWSSDRRFLIVDGTFGGRFGAHLVSTLGNRVPRLLAAGPRTRATFVSGTDSILIMKPINADGITWLQLIAVEGGQGDSIPVERPGLLSARMLSGRRWVVVGSNASGRAEWRIIDRRGQQHDAFRLSRPGVVTWLSDRVTQDALWSLFAGSPASERRLVRLGIDTRYGKFRGGPDTVLLLKEEPFDIADDGKTVVYSDGTYRYDIWVLTLEDALRGDFLPPRHLTPSTSMVDGHISPDGKLVLVAGQRNAAFLVAFNGGTPMPLGSSDLIPQLGWMPDTGLLWYTERFDSGFAVTIGDPTAGTRRRVLTIHATSMREFTPVIGGGWVWLAPVGAGILQVQLPGASRPKQVRKPTGIRLIRNVVSAGDRPRVLMTGFNATGDSVLLYEITLSDGRATRLAAFFGEAENVTGLADGSILVAVQEAIGIATMYRVRGPGLVDRVGVVPRPIGARGHITASLDGRRLAVTTAQYHGDIWLAKVSLTR